MASIQLTQVKMGIANINHDQYHRTNRMDFSIEMGNKVAAERFNGGISAATISALGIAGGGLSHQHQGSVNVEGGWAQRRGLCMLKMNISQNTLVEEQMSVLGYLVGGSDSYMGIVPDDVLFVPVRSWTTSQSSGQDGNYMPQNRTIVSETSQFLMADPTLTRNLQSIRPVDTINYGFGKLNAEEESPGSTFTGTTGADLNRNGIVISKSNNLDPIVAATSLMNHSARVSRNYMGHDSLADNMATSLGNLSETEVYAHPFLSMMMSALSMPSYAGFIGFSFGELRQVFDGFDRVILPNTARGGMAEGVDHRVMSDAMGAVDYHEILANELAFISLHAMVDTGLVFLEFVASNNVSRMNIQNGGIYFEGGIPASVLDNDPNLQRRKESFKNYIESTFFQKYAAGQMGRNTIVGVGVKMNIFGESEVEITLNGDEGQRRKKIFPSYTINRTSSNIAADELQSELANNYVGNLQDYFTNQA